MFYPACRLHSRIGVAPAWSAAWPASRGTFPGRLGCAHSALPLRDGALGRGACAEKIGVRSCCSFVRQQTVQAGKGPNEKRDQIFQSGPSYSGAAGRNRTHDPLVRSQVLYPAELQPPEARIIAAYTHLGKGSSPFPVFLRNPSRLKEKGEAHTGRPGTKKGTRSLNLVPHILARLAGIEPTTPWFVAKYSIQLSYSRPMHAL